MATTASGIYYATETDVASINATSAAMASSIEAKVGPFIGDTGPTATPNSGISWRRIGKTIEVTVNVSGSFPVGASNIAVGVIPVGARPGGINPRGEAFLNGSQPGQLYVTADGTVGALHQTGSTRTSIQGRILYFVA